MARISRIGRSEPVPSVPSASSAVKYSATTARAYALQRFSGVALAALVNTYTCPSAQFRALGQGRRLLRFLRLLLFDSGLPGVERCSEGNEANEVSKPKPLLKIAPL